MSRRMRHQAGLGLVELMVAMVLSLFLLAGIVTVFVSTKQTYAEQQAMAALQENQRFAGSMLGNVIQQGGYFPYSSTIPTNLIAFPANGTFTTAGQFIYGTGSTIVVRYVAAPSGASSSPMINCNGGSNASSLAVVTVNVISVDPAQSELECQVNGNTPQPVISPLANMGYNPLGGGITGLQVLYGVAALSGGSVRQYLTAAEVQAQNAWMQVRTLVVTLDFANPLYNAAHPNGQPQTLPFTRVIDLQNVVK
ncbi:prepilin-type N-terminal cleavage/methylation domain-containing protein [Acidihalobacter prosperus]|nr:prepilin-type N-terminal cleavage/methylation domain-containing protein [Acidihalobacter prosperus]